MPVCLPCFVVRFSETTPKKGEMATEAERLLKGLWLAAGGFAYADLVAFDDATSAAEGQGPVDDADGMVAETP